MKVRQYTCIRRVTLKYGSFFTSGLGCSKRATRNADLNKKKSIFPLAYEPGVGGAVASWLVRSTSERAVRVRALAGDIELCSWARHFTLTVLLSTQVYKWVPANCWGNLTNCREVTCDGQASLPGEVEILLAASCYRKRDKLRQL